MTDSSETPYPENYSPNAGYSRTPDLTEKIETEDRDKIETFLDKLGVEPPWDALDDLNYHELEGYLEPAEGRKNTFQYDVIEGSSTHAHFTGTLDYGNQDEDHTIRLNEIYQEENATCLFHPFDPNEPGTGLETDQGGNEVISD